MHSRTRTIDNVYVSVQIKRIVLSLTGTYSIYTQSRYGIVQGYMYYSQDIASYISSMRLRYWTEKDKPTCDKKISLELWQKL